MYPRTLLARDQALPEGAAGGPNPYVDYARRYTAEGGIELSYKTSKVSFWLLLLRAIMWGAIMGVILGVMLRAFTNADGCQELFNCSFTANQWGYGGTGFVAVALILAAIIFGPCHAIHTIEIRPDCLILDGTDVFWAAHMEARPTIQSDVPGDYVLKGIYGTRFMDFLRLTPVDANDATPAVLANHIEDALKQLWDKPQVWAGD